MEVLSNKIKRSNKNHKCDWCLQIIQRGHHYQNSTIKADHIYTWKNHLHCKHLAEKLRMFISAFPYGVDQEFFSETVNQEYRNLMELNEPEAFLSEDFKEPKWATRLNYVLIQHNLIIA